jgi:hypothetical protein
MSKFNKSNIDVYGEITIRIGKKENPILADNRFDIQLRGLKQSKSGVYCLRNKLNDRLYIGMARNLENRRNRHMRDLEKGEHCNNIIYQDYIAYCGDGINEYPKPSDVFEFEVIIYCYPSQLTFWEGILIDNLKPYYNIHKKKEIKYTPISDEEIVDMIHEMD